MECKTKGKTRTENLVLVTCLHVKLAMKGDFELD